LQRGVQALLEALLGDAALQLVDLQLRMLEDQLVLFLAQLGNVGTAVDLAHLLFPGAGILLV